MTPVEIWQGGVLINKLVEIDSTHTGIRKGKVAVISPVGNGATLRTTRWDIEVLRSGDSIAFDAGEVAVVTEK